MILEKNKWYEYTDPHTQNKYILKYTGTRREIKEVLFDFFLTDNGETIFFTPSEVEHYMKEKKEWDKYING